MSDDEKAQDIPVHEGPDPRDWSRNSLLSMAAEDVRAADAMLDLLRGTRPHPVMSRSYAEALTFLEHVAVQSREALAGQLLDAYKIPVPEEEPELPTEAVGGVRGNGNSPGDRDHLR